MTTATTSRSTRRAAADADDLVTAADAAAEHARQAHAAAQAAAAAAEAELVAALADGAARPTIEKIRERLDLARREAELAGIEAQAAEVRYSRAADTAAAAHRAIAREEYLAAHREYNDPDNRETVLLTQLSNVVGELCQLIDKRQAEHDRLAREAASFPSDERLPLLPGRPITTYGHRGLGRWELDVPHSEIAEAVTAGVTAAGSAG